MVGDGPERPAAEALARELGISEDTRFVGKQEQMEEILPIADLFLLTSEYESFGLAALEAMAAAVPVVSTNAGGLPEINVHGETGYMADVGDVDSMTAFCISILEDAALHEKFGKQAYEHALQFDISNIVPVYEKLYERFLQ